MTSFFSGNVAVILYSCKYVHAAFDKPPLGHPGRWTPPYCLVDGGHALQLFAQLVSDGWPCTEAVPIAVQGAEAVATDQWEMV